MKVLKTIANPKLSNLTIFLFGLCLLSLALSKEAYAVASAAQTQTFASAEFAITELCRYISGSLGALLMAAAGVGAIVSGAFGNFKASYTLIFVAVGAFTVSSMLGFYFPQAAKLCLGETSSTP